MNQSGAAKLADALQWGSPDPLRPSRAVWPERGSRSLADPEDTPLNDPSRADIMLAIWSTLALTDDEDEFVGTDFGQEALSELFDDLHRDLQYADVLMDEEFEDWAIAVG